MALAPFFERIYGALSGHLSVSRESLTTLLENTTVGIRCGPRPSPNEKWIAELTTNLLARLYPRLAISAPEPHFSTLRDLATRINPNIELGKDAPDTLSIAVGSKGLYGAIYPSASGWLARVNHLRPRRGGATNPYAAGAAAALACGELFRRIFLKTTPERDISLSLLDFGTKAGARLELTPGTLGDVIFVAVGAIGNAAVWALARDPNTEGRLWLVDHEDLTLLNLQRYVLGTLADVSRSKVALAEEALRGTRLSIEASKTTLEQFAASQGRIDIPTICISVDNVDARREAQALLPRLLVNGWTGEGALGVSWHVFSNEAACLACLYHPHGKGPSATEQAAKALGLPLDRATTLWVTRQPLSNDDLSQAARALGVAEAKLAPWRGKLLGELYTDVVCGAVALDVTGVGRVETVPLAHQSALAGILMAAELLKRTRPELAPLSQPEALVSWDDVLRPPPAIWRKPRPREPGCICGDPDYQMVYRKKWETALQSGSPV